MADIARITVAQMMRTYLTRKEHKAAGDYSEPVTIRGRRYWIVAPPVFEEFRDTAVVDAVLIDDGVAED